MLIFVPPFLVGYRGFSKERLYDGIFPDIEDQRSGRANLHASGDLPAGATVAFNRHLSSNITVNGTVRADHQAHPTAGTAGLVLDDQTRFRIFTDTARHAGIYTRRIIAVAANFLKLVTFYQILSDPDRAQAGVGRSPVHQAASVGTSAAAGA
jgi:hypothetical protein